MKLKTNSGQITKAKRSCGGLFPISMEQLPISMVKRNDGPSAPSRVVDIELVPSMGNCVSLLRQLVCVIPCSAPPIKPRRLAESVLNQVVAHGQLGPKIFDGVIPDCQCLPIWNVDALQCDSEQLTFNVPPLSNGAPKLMFEGDGFLGNVHSTRTKTPNV